jgi:hypothetical protein
MLYTNKLYLKILDTVTDEDTLLQMNNIRSYRLSRLSNTGSYTLSQLSNTRSYIILEASNNQIR